MPQRSAAEYQQVRVADRGKSLNMSKLPAERLARGAGAEIPNTDPLPKARQSRQAASLQLWCEYNSWQMCMECKAIQPRALTPAGMDKLLSPWCPKSVCIFCRGLRAAPRPTMPPAALQNLPASVVEALRPAVPNFGPVQCSKDRFGRDNGYRVHAALVTFEWCATAVEDRIQQLPAALCTVASQAFDWLLQTPVQNHSSRRMATFGVPTKDSCWPTLKRTKDRGSAG